MRLKFDDRVLSEKQVKEINVMLKAMCKTVVKVPTNSEELKVRLINKTELLPGIIMTETLTAVREERCLTSILNVNDEEVSLSLPVVDLEECEIESNTIQVDNFVVQGAIMWEGRLRELRARIRKIT